MEIYKYILEKSKGLGKAKWLKNLIRKDMNKTRKQSYFFTLKFTEIIQETFQELLHKLYYKQ